VSVATLANRSFVVQRATETKDAAGGYSKSWANVLKVRGRLQPLDTRLQVLHQQQETQVTHVLYVAATPDIREQDRLSGSYDGKTLYVIGVMDVDMAGQYLKIELEGRDR